MARVICIANQKGGVGKTTTSVNLAAALAELDRKVLIIDMDPQGNASSGLGVKRYDFEGGNTYHVLIEESTIIDAMQDTSNENLKVVAANPDLVGAELELVEMPSREYRLKSEIEKVQGLFDYILIDCPPSLGLLTVNALSAANTFLVPLQCEYYALEGLSQLLNTAGLIKKNLNPDLRIEGIVLTMFDKRNNLSHQVVTEIQSHFADKVFQSIIPRNVRLSEAPSHGQSIFEYDGRSIGAKKYIELAAELDEKVQKALLEAQEVSSKTEAEIDVKEPEAETPAESPELQASEVLEETQHMPAAEESEEVQSLQTTNAPEETRDLPDAEVEAPQTLESSTAATEVEVSVKPEATDAVIVEAAQQVVTDDGPQVSDVEAGAQATAVIEKNQTEVAEEELSQPSEIKTQSQQQGPASQPSNEL